MNNKIYVDICSSYKEYIYMKKIFKINKIKNKFLSFIFFVIYIRFRVTKKYKTENNTVYIFFKKTDYCDNKLKLKFEKIIKEFDLSNIIIISEKLELILSNSNSFYINKFLLNKKNCKDIYSEEINNVVIDTMKKNCETPAENNVYYLIKKKEEQMDDVLVKASINFKVVNIITNNIVNFSRIEEKIYNKYEISIVISNNKRKSISKAKYIINLDFNEEDLNEYNVSRNAIIFNVSRNKITNIRGFEGNIINNIIVKDLNLHSYKSKRFSYFYKSKNNKYRIIRYIGNNSILNINEKNGIEI